MRQRTLEIRQFIVTFVDRHPDDITQITADHFKVTRQAARNHLNALVEQGVLKATGRTRARQYHLQALAKIEKNYKTEGLAEDVPWSQDFKPSLDGVPANVQGIVGIAFTEMLNNAIDHSESPFVSIEMTYTAAMVTCRIADNGVGVFRKIATALNLPDDREAILELEKGKLTTAPAEHSGYGIFFTSRMVDIFSMWSQNLFFTHFQPDSNWLTEHDREIWRGTWVEFTVATSTKRTPADVYNEYVAEGDETQSFSKTHVPIRLAQYGSEQLISRSQAKRVLSRFEKFQEVLLDFQGIDFIGQGFADEIFRVFASENPEIKLHAINTNKHVYQMVRLALEGKRDRQLHLFDND